MKRSLKAFLAVVCALALMAGTAVAASVITTRTIQAQFMGIQTVVNGAPTVLKGAGGQTVEPFVYDGDTYVPVRALGEALGKSIAWDNATKTLSIGKTPMAESADELVAYLENSHPAFALDAVPEGYQAARANLLATAGKANCSLYQFTLAAMAYTATLADGHTAIDPFGGTPQAFLDIDWVADGDKLFVLDKTGKKTATEVVKIGGVAVPELFAALDQIVPSENQSARDRNHAQWSALSGMIAAVGVQVRDDYTVELTTRSGDKAQEQTQIVPSVMPAGGEPQPVITCKAMGDVFYVDFNQCRPGEEMDAAVGQLAQAVKSGTTKVIIDVRGNGGGDSTTCNALLSAMGMEAPGYGQYLRYSPLAQRERGYDQSTGSETGARRPEAKPNDKIKLVVLTDENTYSSATMMGVFTQDGKLGTIIGRASANKPNHYGDILSYRLSNGLAGTVSHKQWLRPNESADPNVLKPDLETKIGEDSLQTALRFLAQS